MALIDTHPQRMRATGRIVAARPMPEIPAYRKLLNAVGAGAIILIAAFVVLMVVLWRAN